MRNGEIDGVHYNFTSRDEFFKLIASDSLVEYRSYNTLVNGKPDTWYYGVEKRWLPAGINFVVILDLDGARSFREYYGEENCYTCYITADEIVRRERAMHRGSFDATEWNRRAESDAKVFNDADVADIALTTIKNNGDLSACVDEIYFRYMMFVNLFL
jgi:guanylate kinase